MNHTAQTIDRWPRDGQGSVALHEDGRAEVTVISPLTLWCPQPLDDPQTLSFTCTVHTPDTAMLLMACAQAWRGPRDIPLTPRQGDYAAYAWQDLQMYTIGFNRTGHVDTRLQPNASRMNARRIGGPDQTQYHDINLQDTSPQMKQRWQAWDRSTMLCSVLEHDAGIEQPLDYCFTFDRGRIEVAVQGKQVLVVHDTHRPPLSGGYWAIRNMTPGARFTLNNLSINRHD